MSQAAVGSQLANTHSRPCVRPGGPFMDVPARYISPTDGVKPSRLVDSSGRPASVPRMAHRIDADRDGEHQRVVLALGDLHPIRVSDAEPALRNVCDGVAV